MANVTPFFAFKPPFQTFILMLPRALRLPSSEFLARGYRNARTPYFSLKAKPNHLSKNRIGVIISVAAMKSAARRNFWKRQTKAILSSVKITGFDLLLIASKQINVLSRDQFKSELLKAALGQLPRTQS